VSRPGHSTSILQLISSTLQDAYSPFWPQRSQSRASMVTQQFQLIPTPPLCSGKQGCGLLASFESFTPAPQPFSLCFWSLTLPCGPRRRPQTTADLQAGGKDQWNTRRQAQQDWAGRAKKPNFRKYSSANVNCSTLRSISNLPCLLLFAFDPIQKTSHMP
jgi:hypothetical protein